MEYTKAHLEQLLDMIPYSAAIKDNDQRYRYVNRQFKELASHVNDYKRLGIIGRTQEEIWPKQDRDRIKLCTLGEDDKNSYIEKFCIRGKEITAETQAIELTDQDGSMAGYAEVSKVVEEEIAFQKIVANRHKEISKIYNMFKSNKRIECEITEFKTMIGKLFRILQCDYFSMYSYDNENKKLVRLITKGLEINELEEYTGIDIDEKEVSDGFEDKNTNLLHYISSVDSNHKYEEIMGQAGIRYVGGYPIRFQERVWGAILVAYKGKEDRPYFKNTYMDSSCQQIVWIIKNHFLIEHLLKEIALEREINGQLDMIFDSAIDFLCILDEEGRIKRVSDLWAKNLGYTRETIKGRSMYEFVHEEDVEGIRDSIEKSIREGVCVKNTSRYCIKDGSFRWMDWNGESVTFNGKKLALGVGKDVDREKNSEEKRIQLRRDLEREKHKNMLFSTLSHEFKTPLNIILSITQLLEQGLVEDNIKDEDNKFYRYLDIITRNAYRTLKVANNLIDLIKMDTRTEALTYKYYNIVEVVEEITMAVAKYIENKDIEIIFDTEIEEQAVWCHEESIERIVLNLLSNAIKYSPASGKILVYIRECEGCVRISVQDQGIGIANQIDEAIDTGRVIWNNNTSGLGLKIVDQLISLHKGKFIMENIEPVGTRVIFTIPTCENDSTKECIYRGDLSGRHRESCKKELCDI